MVLTILRIFILYVLATAAVRIMGKRQIGELQPSELVITILLSEIAAIPMQDTDIGPGEHGPGAVRPSAGA